MKYAGWIELGLWVVFLTYWVIMAARTSGGSTRRIDRGAGVRLVIVAAYALLVRLTVVNHPLPASPHAARAVAGILVTLCGMAFAVWARIYLGSNWGMPMNEKHDGQLITTGPYQLVRHPIYTGFIMALAGTACAVGWLLLLPTALLGVYFVLSAQSEERHMKRRFGKDYQSYRERTKMLIPYLL